MYSVRFPDNTRLSGSSWEEVEEGIRNLQFTSYGSQEEFRKDMALRAERWSGCEDEVMIDGSSYDFLCELERCELLYMSFDLDAPVKRDEKESPWTPSSQSISSVG